MHAGEEVSGNAYRRDSQQDPKVRCDPCPAGMCVSMAMDQNEVRECRNQA